MSVELVFGLPLYESPERLPEALESLLAQRDADVAFVLVDDGSDAETPAIVGRYAAADPRIHYERNPRRLGLAGNWRRSFEVARERHPDAPCFAWASDHDVWHPYFAKTLLGVLGGRPGAALAYSRDAVMEAGGVLRRRPPSIDTSEMSGRGRTLWRLARDMRAGQMVYGVFRVEALERAGVFRDVLFPDRLVLTEVALQGDVVEAPQVLWYKRKTGDFSVARQRRAIFPDGAPATSRLPWWIVHGAILSREWGPAVGAQFLAANSTRAAGARLGRR